jgi:LytR cell envelope-related transcriptional attenuator
MGRRELTTTVTMVVLIGILVVGAVWGWRSLFAELPETDLTVDEPAPTCETERIDAGQKIRTRQVRVSVFNAGSRSGRAGETMDALIDRGFQPGDVGNAPSDAEVRRVQVLANDAKDPRARLVARQFGKGVKVQVAEEDLGSGVDVLIGDRFTGLSKAPRSIRVKQPEQVCVPVLPTEAAG